VDMASQVLTDTAAYLGMGLGAIKEFLCPTKGTCIFVYERNYPNRKVKHSIKAAMVIKAVIVAVCVVKKWFFIYIMNYVRSLDFPY